MDAEFEKEIAEIIQAIRKAGYDPYAQLYGYITKGKEEHITRKGVRRRDGQIQSIGMEMHYEYS